MKLWWYDVALFEGVTKKKNWTCTWKDCMPTMKWKTLDKCCSGDLVSSSD